MYLFSLLPAYDPLAVMAIMQSRIFLYFYKTVNQGESRVIPQIKASKLGELPFPDIRQEKTDGLVSLVSDLFALNRITSETPQQLTLHLRKRATLESRIERIVMEFYGLSDADVAALPVY